MIYTPELTQAIYGFRSMGDYSAVSRGRKLCGGLAALATQGHLRLKRRSSDYDRDRHTAACCCSGSGGCGVSGRSVYCSVAPNHNIFRFLGDPRKIIYLSIYETLI